MKNKKNLKTIAISTLAGGLLATAGAGIAKAYTDESNTELLYASLLGAGAGLILSACGLLVRQVYQACAREELSIAASSSDAESSDGDEHARHYLRNLLDSWNDPVQDEESGLDREYNPTPFYAVALLPHHQLHQPTLNKGVN